MYRQTTLPGIFSRCQLTISETKLIGLQGEDATALSAASKDLVKAS